MECWPSRRGVFSASASAKPRGKVVSVRLTKTSFPAAQAKTVKLVCKFSPASKRVVLLLSTKKGSSWVKVRSVSKYGSTKAYTTTVKSLFGSTPLKIGTYRVKVSAEANSITRNFTVKAPAVKPPAPGEFGKIASANGSILQPLATTLSWTAASGVTSYEYCIDTSNNSACEDGPWVSTGTATNANPGGLLSATSYYWQVRAKNAAGTTDADGAKWFSFTTIAVPMAGHWTSAGAEVDFYVSSGQSTVTQFTFYYAGSAGTCFAADPVTALGVDATITGNSFSGSAFGGDLTFSGVFYSSDSAFGEASYTRHFGPPCNGTLDTGPVSWTATWQDASQPRP